jgi:cell division initiation protein
MERETGLTTSLTPVDILNVRFRRGFRGYSIAEVDDFVRRTAAALEASLAECAHLKEQIGTQQRDLEQYRQMENLMRDALVLAQKAADETRSAARAQAEAMLQEAQSHVTETLHQVETLRQERRRLARDLRARLTAQLAWLDEELEDDLRPSSAVEEVARIFTPTTGREPERVTSTTPVPLPAEEETRSSSLHPATSEAA